jgi:hypothetical protein
MLGESSNIYTQNFRAWTHHRANALNSTVTRVEDLRRHSQLHHSTTTGPSPLLDRDPSRYEELLDCTPERESQISTNHLAKLPLPILLHVMLSSITRRVTAYIAKVTLKGTRHVARAKDRKRQYDEADRAAARAEAEWW